MVLSLIVSFCIQPTFATGCQDSASDEPCSHELHSFNSARARERRLGWLSHSWAQNQVRILCNLPCSPSIKAAVMRIFRPYLRPLLPHRQVAHQRDFRHRFHCRVAVFTRMDGSQLGTLFRRRQNRLVTCECATKRCQMLRRHLARNSPHNKIMRCSSAQSKLHLNAVIRSHSK